MDKRNKQLAKYVYSHLKEVGLWKEFSDRLRELDVCSLEVTLYDVFEAAGERPPKDE